MSFDGQNAKNTCKEGLLYFLDLVAGSKNTKKRIASVRNTCKITRTMEMVSTAKSKKLINRLQAATPYKKKLMELIASLQEENNWVRSPYLYAKKATGKRERNALIVITANRGLCGGYNANLLHLAHQHYITGKAQNRDYDLYVLGKKGVAFFNFLKLPVKESYLHINDNFSYAEAEKLALFFMQKFSQGTYSRVEIATTVYYSAGSQKFEIVSFLPMKFDPAFQKKKESQISPSQLHKTSRLKHNYIFAPGLERIANEMVPLAIKTEFYSILLEAMASEQIYRRVAMKNATDAAGEMLKSLTRSYNRARQASITQELAEIVAGADAL